MKAFEEYSKEIRKHLSTEIRKNGNKIAPGYWRGKCDNSTLHILPLEGIKNTKENRRSTILKYLGIEIEEKFFYHKGLLHQYAHHLNSSQLLCYMVFRPLLTDESKPKESMRELLGPFGFEISENAQCVFEYNDGLFWEQKNRPEGTSFDLHIADCDHEYFFEIKFTENGFGKAKKDDDHIQKFKDIYQPKIRSVIRRDITVEECLRYYQLFRNIIRGDTDSKTVVFLTDRNNPATTKELTKFKDIYLKNTDINVITLTWQELFENWPNDVIKPFQYCALHLDLI